MIHHVFANRSNIGDWLSALGIQSLLPGHQPVREYLCDQPFVDESLSGLAEASADDFIIVGGGGLFMDYFTPFWEGLLSISTNIPYGIWGVGYCDLKLEPSRPPLSLLSEVVRRSRFCYVRDDLTRQYLADYGLPPPTGCPSLFAVSDTNTAGHGLLHVDNYTTVGAGAYDKMEHYGQQFADATGRRFRRTNNRIEAGANAELQRIIEVYRQSDVVLSSALHGCILGLALGKKVVAVSGDRKLDSFMAAAGLGQWVCDSTEVDQVPELLECIFEQPSARPYFEATRTANLRVGAKIATLAEYR